MHILIFHVGDQQLAVDLGCVDRVIPMVEVTPLPQAPRDCVGAINMHGDVVPVIDLRVVLGVERREVELKDHLVIVVLGGRRAALWVDAVRKVRVCEGGEMVAAGDVLPPINGVEFVVKDEDHIVLIVNVERLLPMDSITAVL